MVAWADCACGNTVRPPSLGVCGYGASITPFYCGKCGRKWAQTRDPDALPGGGEGFHPWTHADDVMVVRIEVRRVMAEMCPSPDLPDDATWDSPDDE